MESEIRAEVFLWLREHSLFNGGIFSREDLVNGFTFHGQRITLLGAQGIWIPQGFQMPISITTTTNGPYDDGFDADGILNYRYQGNDPFQRNNVGLREAYRTRSPLVYFRSIKPSRYEAVWPIFILDDNPGQLTIRAALDPAYSQTNSSMPGILIPPFVSGESEIGVRRYITALTKQRLHQSAFREFVLDAYARQCSMCRLQHVELLDAAHIIPDSQEGGEPVVQNGLSLCKIHHAAYDRNIIGVGPDYIVKVRGDVLEEVDGPMLRYGLQSLEGQQLILPRKRAEYPDPDRLNVRYREFVS